MSAHPSTLPAVFLGGCLGGLARHALTEALPGEPGWPAGIVLANAFGAFLLAMLLVLLLAREPARSWLRPALGTGFCGAFTTMSAVALSTDESVRDGRLGAALGFLGTSLVTGLGAAALGVLLARALLTARTAE